MSSLNFSLASLNVTPWSCYHPIYPLCKVFTRCKTGVTYGSTCHCHVSNYFPCFSEGLRSNTRKTSLATSRNPIARTNQVYNLLSWLLDYSTCDVPVVGKWMLGGEMSAFHSLMFLCESCMSLMIFLPKMMNLALLIFHHFFPKTFILMIWVTTITIHVAYFHHQGNS